ncbi:MAG: hypothetical protein ACRDTV_05820 [Mycobacterium sp.]
MDVSARSFLTAAMAAAALTLTPSVTPTVADPPAVQLTAAADLFSPDLLDAAAAAGSWGADIEALYNAVEPWVAYGVNTLSWAVGWVPVAGLAAPQLIFFYDLGEPIVQSTLFNTVDVLSGTVSLAEALSNISIATTDAFNAFFSAEIGWIDSMLPPAPPIDAGLGALADLGTLLVP